MAYIFDKYLNPTKDVRLALTSIYGIGLKRANFLCDQLGLNGSYKVNQLTRQDLRKLSRLIRKHYFVEINLKKLILEDIQRFIRISSYKGFRHNLKLPVRGQRTHSNAKNARFYRNTLK